MRILAPVRTSFSLRRRSGKAQNVSTWGWCGYAERRKEFVGSLNLTLIHSALSENRWRHKMVKTTIGSTSVASWFTAQSWTFYDLISVVNKSTDKARLDAICMFLQENQSSVNLNNCSFRRMRNKTWNLKKKSATWIPLQALNVSSPLTMIPGAPWKWKRKENKNKGNRHKIREKNFLNPKGDDWMKSVVVPSLWLLLCSTWFTGFYTGKVRE